MASSTKVKKIRNKMKAIRRGHQRKLRLQREGTTPSKAAFFGDEAANSHGGSGLSAPRPITSVETSEGRA